MKVFDIKTGTLIDKSPERKKTYEIIENEKSRSIIIKGEKGDKGPQGEKGESITGPRGEKGDKGDKGDKGEKGDKGPQGESIIGPRGEVGPMGPQGEKGESITGPKGLDGKSNLIYKSELKPKDEIGENGDWCFTDIHEIYFKYNDKWNFYNQIHSGYSRQSIIKMIEEFSSSGPGGSGDVVGPSSSTDNAIVRFDLTTGKLIKNSSVTIDDSGNVSTSGTINGVTPTEFNYLDATSSIQTQLNNKESLQVKGTATIDFGVTSTDTGSILVTGLTGLTTAHYKYAFIQSDDSTVDNTANDHKLLSRWGKLVCEYTSSTSMTIYCDLDIGEVTGTFKIRYIISI